MTKGLPRRNDINLQTSHERAIWDCIIAVERMGADPALTDAVCYLGKALDALGDYIDGEIAQATLADAPAPRRQGAPTLEELLGTTIPDAINPITCEPIDVRPDFRVAVQGPRAGGLHFIIHPNGHDGETLDFVAVGDTLKRL